MPGESIFPDRVLPELLPELVSSALTVVREWSNSALTVVIVQYSSLRIPVGSVDNR